jgi:cytochrome P450
MGLTPRRMGLTWPSAVQPYGDSWRRKRKLMHAHMHPGIVPRYQPIQLASARRFARALLSGPQTPTSLPTAVQLFLGQTIIRAVYGIDVADADSEFIKFPEEIVHNFSVASTPGRFMIEFLPFRESPCPPLERAVSLMMYMQ